MRVSALVSLLPLLGVANAMTVARVKQLFEEAHIPVDTTTKFDPIAQLFVSFPQRTGGYTTVTPGIHLSLNSTDAPATWSVAGDIGPGPFVLASFDADTPTPMNRSIAQVRHSLQGSFRVDPPDSGMLHNSTPAILDYFPPFPPEGSPAHRYIFYLYRESPEFATQTIIEPDTDIFHGNISDFAAKTNLGDPIAGTFMIVAPNIPRGLPEN